MKEYIVITHKDTDQKEFKNSLKKIKVKILEDYDGLPTTYHIIATPEQFKSVQNLKETKIIEFADNEIYQFTDKDETRQLN